MKNKLYLYALVKSKSALKPFYEFMDTQLAAVGTRYDTLRADAWAGATADETDGIMQWMKDSHGKVVTALTDWHDCVEKLRAHGEDAIKDAENSILRAFDGAAATYNGTTLGYNPDYYEHVNHYNINVSDTITTFLDDLGALRTKASTMSEDYGVPAELTSIETELLNFSEEFADFIKRYNASVGIYDTFISEMKEGYKTNEEAFSSLADALKQERPAPVTKDPSSPVYRAEAFTRVLAALPADSRTTVEELAYAAPVEMQTIFFAYIDQVVILGTDGVPIDPKRSMSLPNLGIFINTHDTTMKTITVYDANGNLTTKQVPAWIATLFHEIGHTIDYATGATANSNLDALMVEDVRNRLMLEAQKVPFSPQDPNADLAALRRQAVENIMNGEKLDGQGTTDLEKLQYLLQTEMRKILAGRDDITLPDGTILQNTDAYSYHTVSDTYGGVTGNAIRGSYWHPDIYWTAFPAAKVAADIITILQILKQGVPSGSPPSQEIPNVSQYIPDVSPQLEYWASNFETLMLGDVAGQEANSQYFPTASVEMEAARQAVLEKARGLIK